MEGEESDELIFLYSLKDGYVEYSYAAHVAKSVGIQANIIERANEVKFLFCNLFNQQCSCLSFCVVSFTLVCYS